MSGGSEETTEHWEQREIAVDINWYLDINKTPSGFQY